MRQSTAYVTAAADAPRKSKQHERTLKVLKVVCCIFLKMFYLSRKRVIAAYINNATIKRIENQYCKTEHVLLCR